MIIPIVEGRKSDKKAVPVLLRRILQERLQKYEIQIGTPIFCPRYKLVRPGELEKVLDLARRKRPGMEAVFVLVDADDDCPKEVGESFVSRARLHASDIPFRATLAKREFESWFHATLRSLRGECGIRDDVEDHENPEQASKKALGEAMVDGRRYIETDDQVVLASRMRVLGDFDNCRSLKKLIKDVETLCQELSS